MVWNCKWKHEWHILKPFEMNIWNKMVWMWEVSKCISASGIVLVTDCYRLYQFVQRF